MTRINIIEEFQGEYRFLSNFWPSLILPPTLEHHYQAEKGAFWRTLVMDAGSPGEAKHIGAKFPVDKWDLLKPQVMLRLVRLKFEQPDLHDLLLATDNLELQEGNRYGDSYWGRVKTVGGKWHGRNELGKVLMAVRYELRTRRGIRHP